MVRAVLVGALALVVSVSSLTTAKAHDWYPWTCCSDRDCRQLAAGELKRDPHGWITPKGIGVPFNDPRIKATPKDHPGVHLCERSDGSVICLYLPEAED